jgi:hypothetical protein
MMQTSSNQDVEKEESLRLGDGRLQQDIDEEKDELLPQSNSNGHRLLELRHLTLAFWIVVNVLATIVIVSYCPKWS